MPHIPFDDSILTWHQLDWLPNVWYYIYDVDRQNRIVDALFKFAPGSKAMLHQHKCPYVTLVLQGELRFYRPTGELKEIRPTGSYVKGVANGEPHLEGGGDQETIVFFSVRNIESELFVFLDANMQPVVRLTIDDAEAVMQGQGRARWLPAA